MEVSHAWPMAVTLNSEKNPIWMPVSTLPHSQNYLMPLSLSFPACSKKSLFIQQTHFGRLVQIRHLTNKTDKADRKLTSQIQTWQCPLLWPYFTRNKAQTGVADGGWVVGIALDRVARKELRNIAVPVTGLKVGHLYSWPGTP